MRSWVPFHVVRDYHHMNLVKKRKTQKSKPADSKWLQRPSPPNQYFESPPITIGPSPPSPSVETLDASSPPSPTLPSPPSPSIEKPPSLTVPSPPSPRVKSPPSPRAISPPSPSVKTPPPSPNAPSSSPPGSPRPTQPSGPSPPHNSSALVLPFPSLPGLPPPHWACLLSDFGLLTVLVTRNKCLLLFMNPGFIRGEDILQSHTTENKYHKVQTNIVIHFNMRKEREYNLCLCKQSMQQTISVPFQAGKIKRNNLLPDKKPAELQNRNNTLYAFSGTENHFAATRSS
ncbi:extensin-like [Tripterygium wilfordii]|uniref:extensin-like n=1 Tax=Tripterygium wilfordii TaxID=458696 RepID=UPI0018F83888|nr:extensin-like [Tripterygium wilfordii]